MLYEIVTFGKYFGQAANNRWHYSSSGIPASVSGSFGLATAFGAVFDGTFPASGTVLRELIDTVASAYTLESVSVQAMYDVEDFYETPLIPVLPGQQGGEALSPTQAYGFRTNRVRTDIGRGYKRFAGVTEAYSGAGGVIGGAVIELLLSLGEAMSATLTYDDEGNTLTYVPCVLHLDKYATSIAPNGGQRYAYKKFPTLAEQLENAALGIEWQYYPNTRGQGSRQYGHGA